MSGIREEEDHAPCAEVALLGSESADDVLDVVDPGLGFDHSIEGMRDGDAVGTASITMDRDGDFGAPTDRFVQPSRESAEQFDVGLVPNGDPDGVNSDAEFMAKDGRDSGHEVKVDVRGGPGFDPSQLGVRDPDHVPDLSEAEASRHPGSSQFLTQAPEERSGLAGTAMRCGVPGWHRRSVTSSPYPPLIGVWNILMFRSAAEWLSRPA
jgi:hypothetical protein